MSREEENRIEDLKEVEAALAALVPRGDRIDRDRLMFLAGQASVGVARTQHAHDKRGHGTRARWAWPSCFAAMSVVAASLLLMLLARPEPQVVERTVEVPVAGVTRPEGGSRLGRSEAQPERRDIQEAGAAPQPTRSPDSYHELLGRVLDRGMDAWKPPAGNGGVTVTAAAPLKYREFLETLLEDPSAGGGRPHAATL